MGAEIPIDSDDADEENKSKTGKTLLYVFERGYRTLDPSFYRHVCGNVLIACIVLKILLWTCANSIHWHCLAIQPAIFLFSQIQPMADFEVVHHAVTALGTALLPEIRDGLGPLE